MKKEKIESLVKKLAPISAGAAMADLAMLLLIFFIATTATTPPLASKVQLPQALTEGLEQEAMRLVVVDEDTLYINDARVNKKDLSAYLQENDFDYEKPVLFLADKSFRYQLIDEVLQILAERRYYKVNFNAEHSLAIP